MVHQMKGGYVRLVRPNRKGAGLHPACELILAQMLRLCCWLLRGELDLLAYGVQNCTVM